jgi:hypothetical protein
VEQVPKVPVRELKKLQALERAHAPSSGGACAPKEEPSEHLSPLVHALGFYSFLVIGQALGVEAEGR